MFRTFISAHSTMFCFQNQLLPFVFSTLSGKKNIFSSLIFKNLFLFQRYFDFPKQHLVLRGPNLIPLGSCPMGKYHKYTVFLFHYILATVKQPNIISILTWKNNLLFLASNCFLEHFLMVFLKKWWQISVFAQHGPFFLGPSFYSRGPIFNIS